MDDAIAMRGRVADRLRTVLDGVQGLRWCSVELIDDGPLLEAAIVLESGSPIGPGQKSALAARIRSAIPELAEVHITARR